MIHVCPFAMLYGAASPSRPSASRAAGDLHEFCIGLGHTFGSEPERTTPRSLQAGASKEEHKILHDLVQVDLFGDEVGSKVAPGQTKHSYRSHAWPFQPVQRPPPVLGRVASLQRRPGPQPCLGTSIVNTPGKEMRATPGPFTVVELMVWAGVCRACILGAVPDAHRANARVARALTEWKVGTCNKLSRTLLGDAHVGGRGGAPNSVLHSFKRRCVSVDEKRKHGLLTITASFEDTSQQIPCAYHFRWQPVAMGTDLDKLAHFFFWDKGLDSGDELPDWTVLDDASDFHH